MHGGQQLLREIGEWFANVYEWGLGYSGDQESCDATLEANKRYHLGKYTAEGGPELVARIEQALLGLMYLHESDYCATKTLLLRTVRVTLGITGL